MRKIPIQIKSLLKKYGRELNTSVHEMSEQEFREEKGWRVSLGGAVGVIAKKNGKFVLVKHTPEYWKRNHQFWSWPGGGVEIGEDFEEAAHREFIEETGLNMRIVDLISIHEYIIRSTQGDQFIYYVAIFKGEVVGGEMKPEKPREIAEIKLFKEVPEKELVPWLRDTYAKIKDEVDPSLTLPRPTV